MSTSRLRPLLLASIVLASRPAAGADAPPRAPELPIEVDRLANGLKVVLQRDPTAPRVTVCVAYHVGSKNERAGRTGFAHFFEHMMFRGTKNVPNYDVPLHETGAQSNAFTNEDMTVYFETVPSNFLERALYLEAERLAFLPSALDKDKFDAEREVVKNERRQSYENVPYGLAEETILANVFTKGHPYSWSVIGSMKDLDRATLGDLKRFFGEFYHPGNATLCLVGDFDPEQAKSWIRSYFGPLAAGTKPKEVVSPRREVRAGRVEQADDVQLPRIYWTWPTVADDHPDSPALDLLATILAGGEASRLHRDLVLDARSAKDVAAISDTKEISGLFFLQATAAEGKETAEIEKVFAAEIDRLRAAPPDEEELIRALAKFEKETYAHLTSPLGRAVALTLGFAQKDDPEYYRRDFERHFRVTPGDVQRVAEEYLKPERFVLLVRPARSGEKEAEAVEAGPAAADSEEAAPPERTPKAGPDWSSLPGPSRPRPFRAPKFVRKSLSNGVDVWIVPWKTLPIVSARILVPVGTADDPPGKSGLATLTATLLNKGTADKTATELAEALETLGVTLTAGASVDVTSLSFSVVSRNLKPALAQIGPLITGPRFDPKDVERERGLQVTSLLQGPDEPTWIAQRALRAIMFGPEHPYGKPGDGYVETVKSLNVEDVREFHKSKFAADRAILLVVGDVEPDALTATLESTLGVWKTTGPRPSARPRSEVKPERGVVYLADKPGAVQSVVRVGRRWVDRRDSRYPAAMIGNHIFGGDFLSRLNQNLREKNGYSYGAQAVFDFRRADGVWIVNTSVRADATRAALKEVAAELDGPAKDRPLTAEEISVARDAEIQSFPEEFEAPGGILAAFEEVALHDLPLNELDTFIDRLKGTSDKEVSDVMIDLLDPSERTILVVGDRKTVEPELQKLDYREIRIVTPDGKVVKR